MGMKDAKILLFMIQSIPNLNSVRKEAFENIVGKGKNAQISSIFPFSHNVLYPVKELPFLFNTFDFVICRSVSKESDPCLWRRVN